MNARHKLAARLFFLVRVVEREVRYLQATDHRLFARPLTTDLLRTLEDDQDLAERTEAFVSRFGRLQDTLGDKLLPNLLLLVGENPAAMIDNLNRAERLGWIASADDWLDLRNLRNRMVHEYIEDMTILAESLNAGHAGVQVFAAAAQSMAAEIRRRLPDTPSA